MTLQRILLHAVAVAAMGATCMAQYGTGAESTRQQQGAQQPSYQQGQQQSGIQQQQPSSQANQTQPGQTGSTQFGQSGSNAPSSMSEPTTQGTSTSAAGRNIKTGKSPDQLFLTKAAQGGLAEVELGNLAQQKAKSEEVKDFGNRMVTDHSQANNELKQLVDQKGITVPSSLAMKDKQTKKTLSTKSGANFDKAYMRDMVNDHEKDVAEFRKEAENGKDPDVKAFAQKTLPTLEQHLSQAKEVAAKVGVGTTAQKTSASKMHEKPAAGTEKPGAMSKPAGSSAHPY